MKHKPKREPRSQQQTGGAPQPPSEPARQPLRARRTWVFRLAAACLAPLVLLVGLDLALRIAGYGYPAAFFRVVSVQGQKRVVSNDQFSRRFFPPHLERRPLPVSFSPIKAEGACRIFVMGESAAMGDPEPAFAFSRILEVLLRERFPGAKFEVINVAFTAINSHVILPIARECARQQGDLWVLYMGHNEVHGPFGPGTVFEQSRSRLWLIRASLALKATKVGQLLETVQSRLGAGPRQTWRGLEMFLQNQVTQDDPRLQITYRQFQQNLEDILRAACNHGTEVILCNPASNLKDSPPFASRHGAGFSADRTAAWDKVYAEAAAAETAGNCEQALPMLRSAAELDPRFAEAQFRLGSCHLALQQPEAARAALVAARDLDTIRLRADSQLQQIIETTANRWQGRGVYLCDTREPVAQAGKGPAPGAEVFFDHVHMKFEGNYAVALSIADQVRKRLPPAATGHDNGTWAAAELCARRLALTDWSQYQMYNIMRRRLLEPPFTNQLNRVSRQRLYADKLNELRANLDAEALPAAAQLCREALERTPDDAMMHELYGRVLDAMGDEPGALAEFKRLTELWPGHPGPLKNAGTVLQKEKRYAEAEAYFRAALGQRPDFAEARFELGVCQAARGDLAPAMASYQRALEDNPDLLDAQVALGKGFQRQGNLDQAERCFRAALENRPTFAAAQLALADVLTQRGKLFDALPHLADAARTQPQSTLAACETAVQLRPQDSLSHLMLANVLATLNKPAEALESLRTAVRLKTNWWEARYLLGVELAAQGKVPEAEVQFEAAIRINPAFARARVNLGVALAKQMKLQEAAVQFQEALRLEPTNQAAQKYLQTIQAMQNQKTKPPG